MRNIYLTKNRKQKYLNDFVNNVLPFNKIPAWTLDNGLENSLIKINGNDHIQSICSKRNPFINQSSIRHESYIEFCYSSEIELILFRDFLPKMIFEFNKNFESILFYDFNLPRQNSNFSKGRRHIGLGCLDDEKYFFINTIRISLESENIQIHTDFWNKIEGTLSIIKPRSYLQNPS
jgi:hypothetical protein